jgi:hypothetical protein
VKRQNQQGDLYVRFELKLPVKESAAVDALESAMEGDVREGISF